MTAYDLASIVRIQPVVNLELIAGNGTVATSSFQVDLGFESFTIMAKQGEGDESGNHEIHLFGAVDQAMTNRVEVFTESPAGLLKDDSNNIVNPGGLPIIFDDTGLLQSFQILTAGLTSSFNGTSTTHAWYQFDIVTTNYSENQTIDINLFLGNPSNSPVGQKLLV